MLAFIARQHHPLVSPWHASVHVTVTHQVKLPGHQAVEVLGVVPRRVWLHAQETLTR